MIQDPQELEALVRRMAGVPRVGVDTEADSLHSYREKLCLIQISTGREDVLVDPLVQLDLQPLLDAFSTSEIILQGADFDVRMLRSVGSFRPTKVFDTTLAARLIGLKEIGLAALVKTFFDVELPKGSQKADWGRRPLPEKMLEYAVNDTRFLLPLAERLEGELRSKGRYAWFEEWCARVLDGAMRDRERDPDDVWRIKGSNVLNPRAQGILRHLWGWRDSEAERADRPSFHVLRNDQLLEAAGAIERGDSWEAPHLRGGRLARYRSAVSEARHLPEPVKAKREYYPRFRPTKEFYDRVDEIKAVRDRVAKELELDPSIIASRGAMEAIARDASVQPVVLMSWQIELLRLEIAGGAETSEQLFSDPGV